MTQANNANVSQPQRGIISRPVGDDTVLTLIGAGAGSRGPLAFRNRHSQPEFGP